MSPSFGVERTPSPFETRLWWVLLLDAVASACISLPSLLSESPMKRLLFSAISASLGMMALLPTSVSAVQQDKTIRASGIVANACTVLGDTAISLAPSSNGQSLDYTGTATAVQLTSAGQASFSVSSLTLQKPDSAAETVVKGFITIQDTTPDSSGSALYLASVSSNITIPANSSTTQDYTLPTSISSPAVTAKIYTDNGVVLPAGTYTATTTLTCVAN